MKARFRCPAFRAVVQPMLVRHLKYQVEFRSIPLSLDRATHRLRHLGASRGAPEQIEPAMTAWGRFNVIRQRSSHNDSEAMFLFCALNGVPAGNVNWRLSSTISPVVVVGDDGAVGHTDQFVDDRR